LDLIFVKSEPLWTRTDRIMKVHKIGKGTYIVYFLLHPYSKYCFEHGLLHIHVREEYTYVPNSPPYSKHRFEHGLLHVHVRAASRASSAILSGAAVHAPTYRSSSFCSPFRHRCSRVRTGVVLEGTCTYMLAHCSACMQKIFSPVWLCRVRE